MVQTCEWSRFAPAQGFHLHRRGFGGSAGSEVVCVSQAMWLVFVLVPREIVQFGEEYRHFRFDQRYSLTMALQWL